MPHHGGRCVSMRKRSVLTPQIGFQFECPECQRQDDHGGQLCNFLLVGTSPLHCWSQDVPSVFLINIYYVFSSPSIKIADRQMIVQSDPSHRAIMIFNLGCLALEFHLKWNIKPFWAKNKTKSSDLAGDNVVDDGYYYISYNDITEEESLGDYSGPPDLHYACSSPSSSCHHGDNKELSFDTSGSDSGSDSGYEEVQVEVEGRQKWQYWTVESELLLVECC